MKTKRFLLAAGILFATVFTVSCGTHFLDEILGDKIQKFRQELMGSNLLQNGNLGMGFMPGSIPPGSIDVIENITVNGKAVEGGSTSITVIATEELKELYISIEGEEGYYVQELEDGEKTEDGKYSYFFPLQFNQELASRVEDGELKLEISGLTMAGDVVEKKEKEIEVKEAESGNAGGLQISVSWDQNDDVDLHVYTPYEELNHLYYSRKGEVFEPEGFGKFGLDIDSNPSCNIDSTNSENVFFDAPLKNGEYKINLRMYRNCTHDLKKGAKYHVTAYSNADRKFIIEHTGQFAATDDYDKEVTIGTITVENGRVVAP